MKKLIATALAALAVSSFSITTIPAQASTGSTPVQNAVNTQPKAHAEGVIDGLCSIYPNWCWD
ncbi:hypothetical protein [Cutibacterium sp. V947]|uniref:hypothetical protein n=1 Tax=unclassified Cutibacterium TaxID=2649671 RepID=UPI003EE2DDC4